MILEKIKKNIGIVILLSLVIIILIVYQVFSVKKPVQPTITPTPPSTATQTQRVTQDTSNYKQPPYSQPVTDSSGQIATGSAKIQSAVAEKAKLATKLPIYIENFKTTTGLKTTLNVYTIPEDPDYLIHVEIYGINFGDPNILQDKNQNAQAFVDSFSQIKKLLLTDGVDIKNIYFIFGAKPYIQSAADSLILKYNLL